METKFYTYSQNNSGGSWQPGMPHYLVVEALSAEDADRRAENAGAYFQGCNTGRDCDCCGDRWYTQFHDDSGDSEPTVYGKSIEAQMTDDPEYRSVFDRYQKPGMPEVRVVYADGRIHDHYRPGQNAPECASTDTDAGSKVVVL